VGSALKTEDELKGFGST